MNLLSALMIIYGVQVGWSPWGEAAVWEYNEELFTPHKRVTDYNALGFDFKLGLEFKGAYVVGKMYNSFTPSPNSFSFSPRKAYYDFSLGYKWKDHINIYWQHSCIHPMATTISPMDFTVTNYKIDAAYERIAIEWQTSWAPFKKN